MNSSAAMRAQTPVRGVLGSKRLGSAALEVELLDPPPVASGLVSGLALPVIHVLVPLMISASCALSKSSHTEASVLVVWTLEPPRTSAMEVRTTLVKH